MRREKESKHTSSGPDGDERAEGYLPPVPGVHAPAPGEAGDQARPWRETSAGGGGGQTGPESREVEAQRGAGDVRRGAGEVVETLGLEEDAGDGGGGLDAEGEAYRRDEGAEEGRLEVREVEEGAEERHREVVLMLILADTTMEGLWADVDSLLYPNRRGIGPVLVDGLDDLLCL